MNELGYVALVLCVMAPVLLVGTMIHAYFIMWDD